MLGMDMMIKALGLDPEEIKQSVTGIGETLKSADARLERLEIKLDKILRHLNIDAPNPEPQPGIAAIEHKDTDNG